MGSTHRKNNNIMTNSPHVVLLIVVLAWLSILSFSLATNLRSVKSTKETFEIPRMENQQQNNNNNMLSSSSYIRLKTVSRGLYLRIDNQRRTILADDTRPLFSNMFRVRLLQHDVKNSRQLQLLAQNHNWVCGDLNRGGQLFANRNHEPSGWETFDYRLWSANNMLYIQMRHAISGKWVCAENGGGGSVSANRDVPQEWETFQVEQVAPLRGVNLGSWLVPEKWMLPELYQDSYGAKDYFTLCKNLGYDKALDRMTKHRSTFITRYDFEWMATRAGINTVRLPIGYWDIIPDEKYHVYVGGGKPFIDKCMNWAQEFNMTVLIDIHGAVGSQNGNDHSGRIGPVDFDPEQTLDVIKHVMAEYGSRSNLFGIELLNEPNVAAIGEGRLIKFYESAYQIINATSRDVVVMFHDGFQPMTHWNNVLNYPNVILDTHRYQLFTKEEQEMTLQEHYDEATGPWFKEITDLSTRRHIMIGEWCAALPEKAYNGLNEKQKKLATKTFFQKQEYAWSNSLGWYFWSYKVPYEHWSLRALIENGILASRS